MLAPLLDLAGEPGEDELCGVLVRRRGADGEGDVRVLRLLDTSAVTGTGPMKSVSTLGQPLSTSPPHAAWRSTGSLPVSSSRFRTSVPAQEQAGSGSGGVLRVVPTSTAVSLRLLLEGAVRQVRPSAAPAAG
ncbi:MULTISPECIES: hypothetical protein [unclassified Streptomyces]|uniref:hypothetical protein n=1 Tax=unclassified Streptomyces TaxID=2593676 RepID=UPI003825BDC7